MRIRLLAAVTSIVAVPVVHGQGVATDELIESITVTSTRLPARAELPNIASSQSAAELRSQNLVNPEDALKYAPNLTIRKRYVGDRNALIGGRSFSTLQPARGLVFMDGYLLSNFLGRFDAPRWNMIAPEEIERVDVLYGPYSALYPGNSIGTTVVVTTRKPEDFSVGVRTTAFSERYEEYGLADDYAGYQVSGYIADRIDGAWWALAFNHQESVSHPMQYYTVSASTAGQFPAVAASTPATPVSGVRFDTDPQGRRRAVFGAGSGAIDDSTQDQVKLRAGFSPASWLDIEAFAALWQSASRAENRTFMRDAHGAPVWSGGVIADGVVFDVPVTALAPTRHDEEHVQWGTTLRTTRATGWNASLVYSQYAIRDDTLREAGSPDPLAANGGPGMITRRDGTGWQTLEVQGLYTPYAADWTAGTHSLALGFHSNEYRLRTPVHEANDWRGAGGRIVQNVRGNTRLQAAYVQDVWTLTDRWSLTLGVRYESWSAFGGMQQAGTAVVDYPDRKLTATSPKAALAFASGRDWNVRLSAGRGVRFPTVAELFQGTSRNNSITVNDPALRAERSDSVDLTFERWSRTGNVRLSLFEDDVRDSIFGQTNITVTPNITNVQNIDRVRSRGAELAFDVTVPGIDTLTLGGNLAYVRSRILEDRNNPAYVGNQWPRVPTWRGALQATWRPTPAWLASFAMRHSGRMYGRLENDDRNAGVYGGISPFTIYDARIAYTLSNGVELAFGVDNLSGERAYQMHPYPGRTGFLEARWSFEAAP